MLVTIHSQWNQEEYISNIGKNKKQNKNKLELLNWKQVGTGICSRVPAAAFIHLSNVNKSWKPCYLTQNTLPLQFSSSSTTPHCACASSIIVN